MYTGPFIPPLKSSWCVSFYFTLVFLRLWIHRRPGSWLRKLTWKLTSKMRFSSWLHTLWLETWSQGTQLLCNSVFSSIEWGWKPCNPWVLFSGLKDTIHGQDLEGSWDSAEGQQTFASTILLGLLSKSRTKILSHERPSLTITAQWITSTCNTLEFSQKLFCIYVFHVVVWWMHCVYVWVCAYMQVYFHN